MWGLWLAVHAVVFSFMSGVIHPYYVVVMAPAVGALVGGGVVAMWRARDRFPAMGAILGLSLAASAGVALLLLDRTPSFAPGLGLVVLAVTALLVPVLALRPSRQLAKLQVLAGALALAMLLAGPAAYAVSTMQTAYSAGNPSAGPSVGQSTGPGGQAASNGTGGGRPPADGGDAAGSSLSTATLDYLVTNQGAATWLVAVSDSTSASQIELTTGKAVMSTGGFTGIDNALSLVQLKAYTASGALRFIEVGGHGGGPGGVAGGSAGTDASTDVSTDVSTWVTSSCTVVTVGGSATSIYDCSTAAAGG